MPKLFDDLFEVIHTWKSFREENSDGDLLAFSRWLIQKQTPERNISDAESSITKRTQSTITGRPSTERTNRAMIGYLLGRMNMFVKNYTKEPFQKLGLASLEEFRLMALIERLKYPNKSELSQVAMMEFSTVNDMLKRLETRGLVAQQKDEKDKRSSRLFLTDEGAKLLKNIFEMLAAMQPKVTGDLSEDEQQKLVELLMRLNRFHSDYFENVFSKRKSD